MATLLHKTIVYLQDEKEKKKKKLQAYLSCLYHFTMCLILIDVVISQRKPHGQSTEEQIGWWWLKLNGLDWTTETGIGINYQGKFMVMDDPRKLLMGCHIASSAFPQSVMFHFVMFWWAQGQRWNVDWWRVINSSTHLERKKEREREVAFISFC